MARKQLLVCLAVTSCSPSGETGNQSNLQAITIENAAIVDMNAYAEPSEHRHDALDFYAPVEPSALPHGKETAPKQ